MQANQKLLAKLLNLSPISFELHSEAESLTKVKSLTEFEFECLTKVKGIWKKIVEFPIIVILIWTEFLISNEWQINLNQLVEYLTNVKLGLEFSCAS